MTDRDTLPAPPPEAPNVADMGAAELSLLRKQRDRALADLRETRRTMAGLERELDALRERYGEF